MTTVPAKTTWTDLKGRTWSSRVTLAEYSRLKSEEGIDLCDPEQLKTLVADPLSVVHLLCCVHGPQIAEEGMTRGDFAEVCTETEGVAVDAADALVEALADFFGRLRKPALANVVRLALEAATAAERQANQLIDSKGRAMMDRAMAKSLADLDKAIAAVGTDSESPT